MLFTSQREKLKSSNIYFVGAARMEGNRIAYVIGTKQSDNNINVMVQYLAQDGSSVTPFHKTIDPVSFERFIDKFAMKVGSTSNGQRKLVDIDHYFVPLQDSVFSHITNRGKDKLLYHFLSQLINGETQANAVEYVKDSLRLMKK